MYTLIVRCYKQLLYQLFSLTKTSFGILKKIWFTIKLIEYTNLHSSLQVIKKKMQLTASQENYIKAIYVIIEKKHAAKAKDISKYLGIGASSVSEALKILGDKSLINYTPYDLITLTTLGESIAEKLIERHTIIYNFLTNVLLIEEKEAEENASKLEHAITGEILNKFVEFLHFTQICPCKEPKWMKGFQSYCQNGKVNDKCKVCMAYCKAKKITKPISNDKEGHKCCGLDDN